MAYIPKAASRAAFFGVRNRLQRGESLSKASRAEGISPRTIRRINDQEQHFRIERHPGKQSTYDFFGSRERDVVVVEFNGPPRVIHLDDRNYYKYIAIIDDLENGKPVKDNWLYTRDGKIVLSKSPNRYMSLMNNKASGTWKDYFYPERIKLMVPRVLSHSRKAPSNWENP